MSGSVYDNGGLLGKANDPLNPVGMWSPAAQYDAAVAGLWPFDQFYTNFFEDTTVENSSTLKNFIGTVDIIENDGTISTADKYAGNQSYYGNSRSVPANRLVFAIDPANINSKRFFTIEFYLKCISFDSFATTFHLIGGTANEGVYFRSNRSSIYAAGIGAATMDNNTGWCTWTNWNKFAIKIDRNLSTDNCSIIVNDVVKYTGTVPQTWTGYSGGKTYISFYQFINSAASDNGVEAYIDSLRMFAANQ